MSDHYAATVTGFLELLGACLVLELMLTVTFRLAIIHETPAKHKQSRLRPRCCHLGSYFQRPKSSPARPLACNWYYCAQFIAKPKAACELRFSWAAPSSNLGYEQI